MPVVPAPRTTRVGRYTLAGEIASGGMATVHYGRLLGPVGFSRTVAIKRLHPVYAKDRSFTSMFLDEARITGRIRHPNVVPTLDVVALEGEILLVMELVQGEPLSRLVRAARLRDPIPLPIVSAIVCGTLHGLHAAHEATSETGAPLRIVHRDVSPQNILVGADGVPRVLDFGIAKAVARTSSTRDGDLKGKLAYMAPEQLRREDVDRRADVFAAGVVLWEVLTLQRLFNAGSEGTLVSQVLARIIDPPSAVAPHVTRELDGVVMRALDRDPSRRFESAREMALALEACVPVASATHVAAWLHDLAADTLLRRAAAVAELERDFGATASTLESGEGGPDEAPPPPSAPDGLANDSLARARLGGAPRAPANAAPSPQTRSPRWPLLAASVLLGAVLAIAATTQLRRTGPPATSIAAAAQPAQTESTGALPEPTAAVTAPMTTDPSVASTAAAPASTAQLSVRPHKTRPRAPLSPRSAELSASSAAIKPCVVRSYVDAEGIRHFVPCD